MFQNVKVSHLQFWCHVGDMQGWEKSVRNKAEAMQVK